ncbi:MAG: hypothetical protein WCO56_15045 [Verrucomicrobiota bacterium]
MAANEDCSRMLLSAIAGMITTFTVCSWLLVGLGVGMTIWLYPNPIAFVPYVLLAVAIRSARRLGTRAVVLVLTLASVCIGFWYFWDAAFIRLSTMNFIPFQVAIGESLVAGGALIVVWRAERMTHETGDE